MHVSIDFRPFSLQKRFMNGYIYIYIYIQLVDGGGYRYFSRG